MRLSRVNILIGLLFMVSTSASAGTLQNMLCDSIRSFTSGPLWLSGLFSQNEILNVKKDYEKKYTALSTKIQQDCNLFKNVEASDLISAVLMTCKSNCSEIFNETTACDQTCNSYAANQKLAVYGYNIGIKTGQGDGFDKCESIAINHSKTVIPKARLGEFTQMLEKAKADSAGKATVLKNNP